jgi:transcriptional regulator with XRE-family HTH domain
MNQQDKISIGQQIKDGRVAKGYTQQELSDLTGISLRSVQRIEKGEVVPRQYTLRVLAEKLGFPEIPTKAGTSGESSPPPLRQQSNLPRKIILSAALGLFLILGTVAFLAQSTRFPETDFELILLWMSVAAVYFGFIYKIWK